jgi:hypothetical protein
MCGVELPAESKTMNVVVLKKPASPPAPTVALKTKKDWAKQSARAGVSLFPIRGYVDPGPGASPEQGEAAAKAAKTPLIANWQNLATQDPRQIDEWWDQWPDANIGGTTESLIAVDIDPRNGGSDTFAFLEAVESFPDTAINRTQGGGKHLIYAAPGGRPVKGGVNKLGPGVDIKARGGYILLPGSTIEGRAYTRENDRPIAEAPQWLLDRCTAAKPKADVAGKRIVEEDEIAIALFTNWLRDRAPRAETGNIDDTTYQVATKGYDFACSQDTVHELMLGWNETHCEPPGDLDRLEVVVESAGRNRENAIGCSHPLAPGLEPVEIDESKAPAKRETGITAWKPTTEMGDAESWENEPNAIFVDHLKPADLPVDVLPELVEQFARDRARRLGVDAWRACRSIGDRTRFACAGRKPSADAAGAGIVGLAVIWLVPRVVNWLAQYT